MKTQRPLFTIFTLAYLRRELLKETLDSLFNQTYKDLEIIVVCNGATAEVIDYVNEVKKADQRVKSVHFKENQYSYEDPCQIIRVCFNAALQEATGDYIFYISDDDLLAADYIEKMAILFEDNPACTSAAGYVRDIDGKGNLLPQAPRTTNYRPRYMPGHLLALSTLHEQREAMMFSAPGCIFALNRKELIRLGGYHSAVERSQLYGIVPFGVTGFDDTAILYWRRHQDQTNLQIVATGFTGLRHILALIQDWQLEQRWSVFGQDTARYVIKRMSQQAYEATTDNFVINFYYCRFKACGRILKLTWDKFNFWRLLPSRLWHQKVYIKYALKPLCRKIFETYPGLVKKYPRLLPLQERAFK